MERVSLQTTIQAGRLVNVALFALSALLISCSSGSNGVDPNDQEQEGEMEMPGTPDGLLPDFTVLSISTSADTAMVFNVQATIMNDGDKEAAVPGGWFLVSTDSNITDNYHLRKVLLTPQSPDQNVLLQPGETGIYTASTSRFFTEVDIDMGRRGTHYGRLWLNPDLSKRFMNPEATVVESHEIQEKDYENNFSNTVAFESVLTTPRIDCTVDAFEENDTLAQATPIVIGETYYFNDCDEFYDVMVVELEANTTYELQQKNTRENGFWAITVVDPGGRYLVRETRENNLITTTTGGQHHIVAFVQSSFIGDELELEIIKR